MKLPEYSAHPRDEKPLRPKSDYDLDTYGGKLQVTWDENAQVTPLGQLSFFIQYMKLGNLFEPFVNDCPLKYESNNAPKKTDLLGSILLSVLSGHTRYAHIATLQSDSVNAQLLGMKKIVSDDSARRGLKKIDEIAGVSWLQKHLNYCYSPLLDTPWILDTDVTIKPLYGKQEGAVIGYNPKKPGRPSHTYHTYMIANLRLVLDVEVMPGNTGQSSHSLPGLLEILDGLPPGKRPQFTRGDCDWGSGHIMQEFEKRYYRYLFKLKKSKYVKFLINKHHTSSDWIYYKDGFEAKEAEIQLKSWDESRRVILVRKHIRKTSTMALEYKKGPQLQLAFVDSDEEFKAYEYSVLVTNLEDEVVSIVQHYRDRADCENVFDEIKNQWGWGGFTTKDMKSSRLMTRIIALIYNWWSLFVRLINPTDKHTEAITSRPLLLSSVGRVVSSGRQKKMMLTSMHAKFKHLKNGCDSLVSFFTFLKRNAPQLTPKERWIAILKRAMSAFELKFQPPNRLCLPTIPSA